MPGDRLRFTIAHELGHIVMHEYYTQTMEGEADRFAAELLMPEYDIRSELIDISMEKLASLKMRWKTSMQSLLYRAGVLGRISDRQKQYLWMQMGKAGYRLQEPIDVEVEHATLYREIIDAHFEDLNYTLKELCDVICLHEDEFEQFYLEKKIPQLRLIKHRS